jgi:hypothetical protein
MIRYLHHAGRTDDTTFRPDVTYESEVIATPLTEGVG